jgi:mono/diheme cytochrome c family protein
MIRSSLPLLLPLLLLAAACDRISPEQDRRADDAPALPPLDPGVLAALPEGASEEEARQGAEDYARSCAICHGPDAAGTQLAPPLVGRAWTRVEPQPGPLTELIRNGVARAGDYPVPMPPRGGGDFDDAEIDAIALYVLALQRSSTPRAQPGQEPADQPQPEPSEAPPSP